MLLMKDGRKVMTASGEGVLNLFSWDWFGDCNDRIVGHPNSIQCMVKYDEDTVITGGEDGLLRVVSVLPNRIIAIVGDAMDDNEGFHIQAVTLSHDRRLVASCSPDDIVKIMDVSHFANRPKDGSFNLETYEATLEHKPNHGKLEIKSKQQKDGSDDWSSDSDAMSDSDDSNDSDDSMEVDDGKHKKKNKKLNPKKNHVGLTKKMINEQKKRDFFKDM